MAPKSEKGKIATPDPHNTFTTSYVVQPVSAATEELQINADAFLMSTRTVLWLRNLISTNSLEIDVGNICVMWDPKVEPLCRSSVAIKLYYDHPGDQEKRGEEDSLFCMLTGVISEALSVTVYPTRSLVYPKGGKLTFPWRVKVETSCFSNGETRYLIGGLHIWCKLNVKLTGSMKSKKSKQYKPPSLSWTNAHYPFYIPTLIVKGIRCTEIYDIEDTREKKLYTTAVLDHCKRLKISEEDSWNLMQTMTHEDANKIMDKTNLCGKENDGSFCTCHDSVSDLIQSFIKTCHSQCYLTYKSLKQIKNGVEKGMIMSISEAEHYLGNRS
ncbi:TPA_asm: P3 [Rhododendron delavayi virus 1]|uniref:P3 n=1 Tax=Rhododendron delavayi virus 1 TaxID=2793739 RepID=A0A8D9UJ38_9RHAB|nr:P3 [Rhododendron delavayi virus 1]DAF42305.1 TPA_asm: P3 [Rhododendron delavayi virus 1]